MEDNDLYLITGAAGHLGSILVSLLLALHQNIRVLVLPKEENHVGKGVECFIGDVRDPSSMSTFFQREGYTHVTLIHLAALITISSKKIPAVWDVNVNGTENVLHLAYENHIDRVIYVSSVHAIEEKPKGEVITEVHEFSPSLLKGQYAKSKAAAAALALSYAKRGMNISVVHPSGIIGPGDKNLHNHMVKTLKAMEKGSIPISIHGGYDFVDVRDVAQGILDCAKLGRSGECYILNGQYVSVKDLLSIVRKIGNQRDIPFELPTWMAAMIAPIAEKTSHILGDQTPILTPYSIFTLQTNSLFSHEKATKEFNYHPRELLETIKDTLEDS